MRAPSTPSTPQSRLLLLRTVIPPPSCHQTHQAPAAGWPASRRLASPFLVEPMSVQRCPPLLASEASTKLKSACAWQCARSGRRGAGRMGSRSYPRRRCTSTSSSGIPPPPPPRDIPPGPLYDKRGSGAAIHGERRADHAGGGRGADIKDLAVLDSQAAPAPPAQAPPGIQRPTSPHKKTELTVFDFPIPVENSSMEIGFRRVLEPFAQGL